MTHYEKEPSSGGLEVGRGGPIRVLVVDDSHVMRHVLRLILESDTGIRVVGEARNGQEALEQARLLQPNVITMDVRMPVLDGLATTEQLMAFQPTPILAVTGSLASAEVDIAFRMLAAGALDVVETPELHNQGALDSYRLMLIRRVKLLAGMRVVTHLRGRRSARRSADEPASPQPETVARRLLPAPAEPVTHWSERVGGRSQLEQARTPQRPTRERQVPFPVVVIGSSAGGPRAVQHILNVLPAALPAAIVIAQHIAEGFSAGFADWLNGNSALQVQVAQEQTVLKPGVVVLADDGCDMVVSQDYSVMLRRVSGVSQRPRPSVDLLMESAAEVFGRHTIGVLLSGMGRDGAVGLQRIRQQGGYTLAQNEATCPIYGMPRAAIELGVVDAILTPDAIAQAIRERLGIY
ncbi:MAG: chemotaxis-specific protein-glutamate methyltransferase CheB [Chloroflexaceae bacterium]|nr:chemotaxis-specific protein-glutamate methyltransferase CheB [Chloroflexaceae bacterium]NJO04166.1 chemotaxis-specific protein-glutamate methyltransferase CheB [Chloroflexaceae bacterium]